MADFSDYPFAEALGLLADALAVMEPDGSILFATEAAAGLLSGADGVLVRSALLTRTSPEAGPLVDLEVPRQGRHSLTLRLQRLAQAKGQTLIVIHDPEQAVRLDTNRLTAFYGLTPTEAQLAAAIAEGTTLASFAASRGCSEQTARTHLKRVLHKTHCTRQVDLVRRLLSNPLLHQGRGRLASAATCPMCGPPGRGKQDE